MARKKNLERAIVLGLLLSTSVCGSAWADFVIEDTPLADYYVEGMFDSTGSTVNDKTIYSYTDHNLDGTVTKNHDYRLAGYPIAYGVYTHAQGGDVEATINVNNFNINVRNFVPDVHDHIANEIEAAGIVTGAVRFGDNENNSSITNIISTGNISIDVITQNSKNAYGIYSKKNGTTDIKTDGIVINVKKTLDSEHKFGYSQNKIADSDYSKSSVYGINSEQGNTILNAANNIEISASIDIADNMKNYSDYQSNYDELLKGNIYAVSNTNGTIDLSTGNENETGGIISLSATANKGNAYGLYTKNGVKNSINNAAKFIITAKSTDGQAFGIYADNDKNNEYNNLTNYIHAESDSGEAYGIYAINGSQIDIIATGTDENGYGNTITSNKIGVDISSGTQLNITGKTYIAGDDSAMLINAATTTVNGGDGTGANVIKSKSGNALKAVESIVTLNSGANGANSIVAGKSFGAEGVYYTGTAINATSASNGAENNRTGGSKIDVLGSENFIGGTVRANGVKSIVNIGGSFDNDGNLTSSGTNYITSAAHGRDGSSNEDVVSAVFAQNGANVNIKAGEGQRNYIIAQSENIEPDKTNESDKPKYNERAVWAQGGSQVNIEGETIISASKAEVEFENAIPKNITLDDLRNNNLGIAIAAGTGEITNITDPGDLVKKIPEGVGKSTINLNYKGSSVILGDVVSGWNG